MHTARRDALLGNKCLNFESRIGTLHSAFKQMHSPKCSGSSAGQSDRFLICRSEVRTLSGAPIPSPPKTARNVAFAGVASGAMHLRQNGLPLFQSLTYIARPFQTP